MKRIKEKTSILICLIAIISCSCAHSLSVDQMGYVQDPDMQMTGNASELYQNYIYTIREGSVPTITIKGNGGCGCN